MKVSSFAAGAVTDFKTVGKGFLKELPRQAEAAAIWFVGVFQKHRKRLLSCLHNLIMLE